MLVALQGLFLRQTLAVRGGRAVTWLENEAVHLLAWLEWLRMGMSQGE